MTDTKTAEPMTDARRTEIIDWWTNLAGTAPQAFKKVGDLLAEVDRLRAEVRMLRGTEAPEPCEECRGEPCEGKGLPCSCMCKCHGEWKVVMG